MTQAKKATGALFPWPAAMRIGFGQLRLSPKNFWSMTPLELAAASGTLQGQGQVMPRSRLAELIDTFPDKEQSA